MRMHKFVYILYFFFLHATSTRTDGQAHVSSGEFNYKETNTNLPSIFETVHRVFEKKSTSLKISDKL